MNILIYSLAASITGFILDLIFGDPYNFPHIVRLMGRLISLFEKKFRLLLPSTKICEKIGGFMIVVTIIIICTGIPTLVIILSYLSFPILGFIFESFFCWQCLAAKSLKVESMKIHESLLNNDLEGARKNISYIVGRDTKELDQEDIIRATVETVAENTSDGVTAPLLFIMLGGAPLGCLYKAVNTMDSMIGYKNEKYINFGYAAAKLDDLVNYLPSRICSLLMIIASFILRFDGKLAFRIWQRDKYNHESPNSAQTEAACAGALGIRLAGPSIYFGKLKEKPYIGDEIRKICINDIRNANKLMYLTSILTLVMAVIFRLLFLGGMIYGGI